jgi:hypothetical protein
MKDWVKPDRKLILLITVISTLLVWAGAGLQTIYANFDGPYYIVVAKSWYNSGIIRSLFSFSLPLEYYPAHLPLYPLLINLVSITGINHLQSMLLVNLGATLAAAWVIFEISKRLQWGNPFWITLAWLFWWPRMWAVRSVGSPETLFIMTTVASLYFFQTKKYWLSGVCGSLAVLTKSPGIVLLAVYTLVWAVNGIRTRKRETKCWPVILIGLTFLGLFYFFFLKTGDFWAYFHTGDNIHLQLLPFRVFDAKAPWVGSIWLSDVIWIYLVAGIGVYRALKKSLVWGIYGLVFYLLILFVSHRDIARYSLPLVPVVLLGLGEIFEKKEARWAVILLTIPLFFYTLNFVLYNTVAIADWGPLL